LPHCQPLAFVQRPLDIGEGTVEKAFVVNTGLAINAIQLQEDGEANQSHGFLKYKINGKWGANCRPLPC